MMILFVTLHILISLFLVMVVLLQQGSGADLSVFGGGGTMTAFGARGAATLLHKLTVIGFVLFILTTITIGVLESQKSQTSVMGEVAVPAAEEPEGEDLLEPTVAGEELADEAAEALGAEEEPAAEATPAGEAPAGEGGGGGEN